MIYITGDLHGDTSLIRLKEAANKENIEYLIVTGDFGYGYFDNEFENSLLDEISKLNYTILWVDGNHEGFDNLKKFPVENWCGGTIHKLRDNIFHLNRGEIYTINNKTFFTFGGARSVDIYHQKAQGTWFEEEMPTKAEMDYGIENLEKYNYTVDYIITHTCDEESLVSILPYAESDELVRFFTFIKNNSHYKKWYFGHMHIDCNIDNIHRCMYRNIIELV